MFRAVVVVSSSKSVRQVVNSPICCGGVLLSRPMGTKIAVILIEDVDKQGQLGEVVKVKRGFARNYLIPRQVAGI